MLENEVVDLLGKWLEDRGWTVSASARNRERGIDIKAQSGIRQILIEAKGARGNPGLSGVVRPKFDSGQLKCHLGKAIVKILELKQAYPDSLLVIAHPDSAEIRDVCGPAEKFLRGIGILFAFVREDGSVMGLEAVQKQKAA